MNSERVERGDAALNNYMDEHPDYSDDLILTQEALTDLLADLRHACHDNGLDFNQAVTTSEIHFEEERS